MASLNINQLTTHTDELRILLTNNDINIVSINETKLNESIRDHEVHISGYNTIQYILLLYIIRVQNKLK